MIGECLMMLEGAGTDNERVVVTQADDLVWAVPELIEHWLSGTAVHVRVDPDLKTFHFGTDGEGVGVVTYRATGDRGIDMGNEYVALRRVNGQETTEGSMTDPLIDIESASVELRLSGGKTYSVEFKNAVVPLRASLDIEADPVEGPPTNGYRQFVPSPMLGDLTLKGYVEKVERTTPGPDRAGNARRIVAQRFQDERGVDPNIAAERILNDLVEAGHLPGAYATTPSEGEHG
jgi:hypothetical protein